MKVFEKPLDCTLIGYFMNVKEDGHSLLFVFDIETFGYLSEYWSLRQNDREHNFGNLRLSIK